MQRNILSGSEFLLYNINDEPVAYSKNCAISINQSLTDVTTKNSDSWSEFMVGLKDWSIEFEGLVSYGEGFSSNYFLDKYQKKEPFFIKFGVVQDAFTHAFYGEVYIESINQSGEIGEIATFSGNLKGVGNLSFTDEGTPEQSGYLKTETDPVFRGSPAFSISDTDKLKWNESNSKIVQEIQFVSSGSTTTLKMKFRDGSIYSAPFENINSIDLSGYYTKGEADTKIATAQVAADTANTLLYNIGNDSKLTPNEKVNLLKEWQIIQDEKPKLVEQALLYGVETLNYDISFIDLDEYLEPLLISMESTTDIWGYELRDTFRAYYEQKVLLLKALSEASKLYTDDEIKNIKIGNRNYHLNGAKSVLIYKNQNQILQTGNYPSNTTLAISFMAKANGSSKLLHIEFEGGTGADFITTSDWKRYDCILNNAGLKIFNARLVDSSLISISTEVESQILIDQLGFPYRFPIIYNTSNSNLPTYNFPYKFPMSFNSSFEEGIELKNIMIVEGNKSVDFYPAPEDFYGSIALAKEQATEAANQYAVAQRLLAEINSKAYADGIVTDLEQINIDLAESNLLAAKQYADVVSLNAKVLANAYADGKIDDIEVKIIDSSNSNILASKAYSDSQDLLTQQYAKAYADGIVDATEEALLQNATNNLASAKAYSDAQDLVTKTLSNAYTDGKISIEEQRRIDAVEASLVAAKAYNDAQIEASAIIVKAYADGVIDNVEAALIENANNNLAAAKAYSDSQDLVTKTLANSYADNKITAEEQARITAVQDSLNAAKAYTEAQRVLSETIVKAYADGVVDAEEARAIADAQAKLNAAKAYADQKALDLKTEIITVVDQSIVSKANEIIASTTNQINVANTATLQTAANDAEAKATIAKNAAIASSNSYTQAQRTLTETTAAAYVDGKVTAEEQARINQAANNLQAAKDDSTNKSNAAAAYGIAAQNLHNALVGNLKSLAYLDVVEVSKLGSTIVSGGYIKTSLLDANYIKSDIINSTYINTLNLTATNIVATTGKIGSWDISTYGLTDTTGSAYILSSVPYSGGGKTEAAIGLTAASSSNPDTPSLGSTYYASRFLSTSVRGGGFNTAIYAEAAGSLSSTAARLIGDTAVDATGSIFLRSGNLILNAGTNIIVNGTLQGQTGIVRLGSNINNRYTGFRIVNGLIIEFGNYPSTLASVDFPNR
jgi:hypothetical protein